MAYREPGVQSVFVASPGGESLIGAIRLPAIVGQGASTYQVTEVVVRGSGTQDTLAHTASQIVRVGNYSSTTDYQLTTDYLLTAGKIDWSPASAVPTTGQSYYVTYKYAKATGDYIPKLFDNMDDVLNEYGPITFTGTTLDQTSYLSLGAKLAFGNGAQQVILCQVNDPATAGDFDDAFTLLEEEVGGQNPNIIIALLDTLSNTGTPSSNYDSGVTYLLAHVNKMSDRAFGKERTAFTSLWDGASVAQLIAKATAVNNERMVVVGPSNAVYTASYNGVNADCQVGGNFIACALAGLDVSQDPAEPLTRKLITGFKSLATNLTKTQMDNLATAGVCVIKQTAGILRVRHGVTTNMSTANTQEITVVQIKDYCIQNVRVGCDSYVGKKLVPGTPAKMKESINTVLGKIIEADIIAKKGSVMVKQDQAEPRKVKVSFSILPVYPLNWVDITFTIDLGLLA